MIVSLLKKPFIIAIFILVLIIVDVAAGEKPDFGELGIICTLGLVIDILVTIINLLRAEKKLEIE